MPTKPERCTIFIPSDGNLYEYYEDPNGAWIHDPDHKIKLDSSEKLKRIAEIIEGVDHRCMAADGPVTPTLKEMTQSEISEIYKLSLDK